MKSATMKAPKLNTWTETDKNGIQWHVQRVTGTIARILCERNSYLAYYRLTPLPGEKTDDRKVSSG